jgi:hypothetical protein
MEALAKLLKALSSAYLIGRCWRCAEVLDALSSGRGGEGSLLDAYGLYKELYSSAISASGLRCCAAEPLSPALDEEACEIYGGVPLRGAEALCCAPCPEIREEEVLEALEAVEQDPQALVRAVALAQAPTRRRRG